MSPNPSIEATPLGNLHPAPWNPRLIRDERFKNLCRSIEADPDFLWRRPVLAMADGTIYAGNMRYRAAEHLKLTTVPAIIEDVSEQLAKERALRDNNQWGDFNDDELARLVFDLKELGSEIDLFGFEQGDIDSLLAIVGDEPDLIFREYDESIASEVQWNECPECGHRWPK